MKKVCYVFVLLLAASLYGSQDQQKLNEQLLTVIKNDENVELVIDLIKQGADSFFKDDLLGRQPAHFAARHGCKKVLQLLIDRFGVDPNVKANNGYQPIHYAAAYGQVDVLQLLIDTYKVEPNVKGKDGKQPIHYAAGAGQVLVFQLLVDKYGVDVTAQDIYGEQPIHYAAEYGHENILRLLIDQYGVNPGAKRNGGYQPIHDAARGGNIGALQLLIDIYSVNPNAKTDHGFEPIIIAADYGQEDVLRLLMDRYRANIHSHDGSYQVIHYAVANNCKINCVQQLLFRGVNPHCATIDIWGSETAIDIAQSRYKSDFMQLLTRFTYLKPMYLKKTISQEPVLQNYHNPEQRDDESFEQFLERGERDAKSFEDDVSDYWKEKVAKTIHDDEAFKDLVCNAQKSNIPVISSLFKSSYHFLSVLKDVQKNLTTVRRQDSRLDQIVAVETSIAQQKIARKMLRNRAKRN